MTPSVIYAGIGGAAPLIACLYDTIARGDALAEEGPNVALFCVALAVQPYIALDIFNAALTCRPPVLMGLYESLGVMMIHGGMFVGAAYYAHKAKDNPVTLYNLKRIALIASVVLGVLASGSIVVFGAARTAQIAVPIFWHFLAAPLAGALTGGFP